MCQVTFDDPKNDMASGFVSPIHTVRARVQPVTGHKRSRAAARLSNKAAGASRRSRTRLCCWKFRRGCLGVAWQWFHEDLRSAPDTVAKWGRQRQLCPACLCQGKFAWSRVAPMTWITIPWPGGFLRGVVDGLRDTAAAEWIEELGVLNRLLKACSEDCAWSVSVTITCGKLHSHVSQMVEGEIYIAVTWESSELFCWQFDSAALSDGGEIGGHLGCSLSSLLTSS